MVNHRSRVAEKWTRIIIFAGIKKKLYVLTNHVTNIVDFFHPPFRRWMPLQTFRYAACGGGNTLLGYMVYSISLKYIFKDETVHFGPFTFKHHVAALIVSFLVNFPVGFLLMKFVVFID